MHDVESRLTFCGVGNRILGHNEGRSRGNDRIKHMLQSRIHFEIGELTVSRKYLDDVVKLGALVQNEQIMYKAYFHLFNIAMAENNESQALNYHIKYHDFKEKLINSETRSKIKSLESMWKWMTS